MIEMIALRRRACRLDNLLLMTNFPHVIRFYSPSQCFSKVCDPWTGENRKFPFSNLMFACICNSRVVEPLVQAPDME